jgi:hypothetical protein
VQDAAASGSCNYQLLLKFVAKGAQVVGTEDPHLLLQEYNRLRNTLDNLEEKSSARRAAQAQEQGLFHDEFIEQRDRYIAQRINKTLHEGETGLLFIGALHRVYEMLPNDIHITYLLPL